MGKEIVVVTAALMSINGKYLITQRPANEHLAGKWEFPGGGLKFGETPEACLEREIWEELGLRIKANKLFGLSSYIYDEKMQVILIGYLCRLFSTEIKKDVNYAWVAPVQMDDYDFCPADMPLIKKLQEKPG